MQRSRRAAIGILVLLALGVVAVPRSADAQRRHPQLRWLRYAQSQLQFSIRSGRIVVTALRSSRFTSPWSTDSQGRKEQMTIQYSHQTGSCSLSYHLFTPEEKLSITAGTDGRVAIRRKPGSKGKTVPSEFLQEPSRPLMLTFGKDAEKRSIKAPTIWHLLLAHRDACKRYVLPSFELLHPNWKLLDQADQVEKELLAAARSGKLPDRKRWAELVDQLGDPRFARREAADRQLRALGRPVVAHLRSLDRDKLDAEQQYRIHRIIRSLTSTLGDESAGQVANTMLGDPTIWLILLGRDSKATRQTAARHIERLLDGPIDFDPAADPATRKRQIEALRRRIAEKQ